MGTLLINGKFASIFRIERMAASMLFGTLAVAACAGVSNLEMGQISFKRGNYNAALDDFNTVLAKSSDSSERARAYSYRGATKLVLIDIDGAIADETEAIRLIPSAPSEVLNAYLVRAYALGMKGQYDAAMQDCGQAFSSMRGSDSIRSAHQSCGQVRLRMGDFAGSANDLRAALKDEKNSYLRLTSLLDLIYAEVGAEDLERAQADANRAVATSENSHEAYVARAFVYWKRGQTELALQDAKKANFLAPHSSPEGSALELGLDRLLAGDPAAAIPYWERARSDSRVNADRMGYYHYCNFLIDAAKAIAAK